MYDMPIRLLCYQRHEVTIEIEFVAIEIFNSLFNILRYFSISSHKLVHHTCYTWSISAINNAGAFPFGSDVATTFIYNVASTYTAIPAGDPPTLAVGSRDRTGIETLPLLYHGKENRHHSTNQSACGSFKPKVNKKADRRADKARQRKEERMKKKKKISEKVLFTAIYPTENFPQVSW